MPRTGGSGKSGTVKERFASGMVLRNLSMDRLMNRKVSRVPKLKTAASAARFPRDAMTTAAMAAPAMMTV